VARPVFHCVSNAVFGPDGALARLREGQTQAVYLEAGGLAVVVTNEPGGQATATALTVLPGAARPATTAELLARVSTSCHRAALTPEPTSWPSRLPTG
jgi:hypothetical protein